MFTSQIRPVRVKTHKTGDGETKPVFQRAGTRWQRRRTSVRQREVSYCYLLLNVCHGYFVLFLIVGLTENAGRENDGPSKSQGMKLQDMKMTDMKMTPGPGWNGMLNLYSVYSASNVRRLCALLCPAFSCPEFHVLQFHALQIGPSISRPAFSAPAFSAPPYS